MKLLQMLFIIFYSQVSFSEDTRQYADSKLQSQTLDNGLEVRWLSQVNRPIVDMRIRFAMGSAADGVGESGASEIVCRILAKNISQALVLFGTEASCQSDVDQSEILIEALAADTRPILDTVVAILNSFEVSAGDFQWAKAFKLEVLRHRADQPDFMAQWYLHQKIWKGTIYERGYESNWNEVQNLTIETVRKVKERMIVSNLTSLLLRGGLPIDFGLSHLQKWKKKSPVAVSETIQANKKFKTQKVITKESRLPADTASLQHEGSAQAWFYFGMRLDPAMNRAMLIVLNSILGDSLNSRLTADLRDKKGLVYRLGSRVSFLKQGIQWTVEGSSPASLASHVQIEVQKILDNLFVSLPTQLELESAKKFLTGRYFVNYDPLRNRLQGMDLDFQNVTLAEVHAGLSQLKKWNGFKVWAGDSLALPRAESISWKNFEWTSYPQKKPQKKSQFLAPKGRQKPSH